MGRTPSTTFRRSGLAPGTPGEQRMRLFDKVANFTRARKLQEQGLYPYFRPISDSDGTTIVIEGETKLNFGSNNYLGLTHHPRVIEAGKEAAQKYGSGCTGSRFLNGTLDLHEQLEANLAELLNKEAAIVFPTGYHANLGMVSGLVARGEMVVIDKADHASVVDGARLCFGSVTRFEHGHLDQLERLLEKHQGLGLLVVVDGVHSMHGDITDLPKVAELAHRYGAALAVDDAHAVGVLGENGEGTPAHFGVEQSVDLIAGTFSKSMASIGGFVAGGRAVIHYLKHHSRPMIFSASLPPFSVATVIEALDVMISEPERRVKLWENSRQMATGLRELGFELGATETPIVPVHTGDDGTTFLFWRKLFDLGVFTNPVIPPAVPLGQGRMRVSLIATHSEEQIGFAIEAFEKVGKELGIL